MTSLQPSNSQPSNIALPIAGDDAYRGSTDAWIRAIKRVETILARTASTETQADFFTGFTNPSRNRVPCVNFATDARVSNAQPVDTFFNQLSSCFEDAETSCLAIQCVGTDWPPALAAEAEARGFVALTQTILRLSGLTPQPDPDHGLQIIPARAIYRQTEQWAQSCAARHRPGDEQYAAQYGQTFVDFLDEPRFESYLGRDQGRVVGSSGVVTLGQTGVLFGVAVDDAIAPANTAVNLIQHTIDLCRRAQFEDVLVPVSPDDPLLELYRSLGFEPATTFVKYVLGNAKSSTTTP